jgi:hypothetical protein
MTTQIVLVSTAFGLATITAAYDSCAFARCECRVLVVACNTSMPEAGDTDERHRRCAELMGQFDAVYDYNACIEPQHPSIWRPRPREIFPCGSGISG